jgi:hypothetical protein
VLMAGEVLVRDPALAPTPAGAPLRTPPDASIAQPIDRANRRSRALVVSRWFLVMRGHPCAGELAAG